MPLKIVVLDSLPLDADHDLDWSGLRTLGNLTLHGHTTPDQTSERVAGAGAVFTNKVRLGAAEMDAAGPSLKLISVLATGYDIVDVDAARERGITVCNVAGYSTPSTAQTAIALLLELANHVGEHSARVHAGDWSRANIWSFWTITPVELDGKTLVLIGSGKVGTRVGRIAEALGMHVLAATLPGRPDRASEFPRLPLDEALAVADAVSFHAPLTPETRSLLNSDRLRLLKPTAFVVNTARGPIVDDAAVADALREGRLAGYAADVLTTEPPPADNPLLSAPRCLLTPHYAWASRESRGRLLNASIENLRAFLAGAARNVVS